VAACGLLSTVWSGISKKDRRREFRDESIAGEVAGSLRERKVRKNLLNGRKECLGGYQCISLPSAPTAGTV